MMPPIMGCVTAAEESSGSDKKEIQQEPLRSQGLRGSWRLGGTGEEEGAGVGGCSLGVEIENVV